MASTAPRKRARRQADGRPSTREVQADVEGLPLEIVDVKTVGGEVVAAAEAVEFLSKWYRIADTIGLMPLLKFAHAAGKGLDSGDLAGMAAMYAMLRDCIHPDDWTTFEYDAMDERADDETLLAVVRDVTQKITSRPTKRPSGSSAGPRAISANSKVSSSSPDTGGLVPVSSLTDRSTR